jgi:hypothetical protein
VVSDLATPLRNAFEDHLTGYCRLESQDALLLSADGVGVVTFEAGIPAAAYHTGTDAGGADALADIAVAGPYRIELFELDDGALDAIHDAEDLAVSPTMPARRLAGDPQLADRTAARATDDDTARNAPPDAAAYGAVEAFLADEDKIDAIRDRAREEARRRASEWGFD